MADVVSPAVRSRMMAGIRSTNTRPELIVRRGLHARGFRFRLHENRLPGRPDIVLPRYHVVIQVNGCFWHGHDCNLFKWPSSNPDFWREKIHRNQDADRRNEKALLAAGWRVFVVWECAMKGPGSWQVDRLLDRISGWVLSARKTGSVEARRARPVASA